MANCQPTGRKSTGIMTVPPGWEGVVGTRVTIGVALKGRFFKIRVFIIAPKGLARGNLPSKGVKFGETKFLWVAFLTKF